MRIDEQFNSIVYENILPDIARAFVLLEKSTNLNCLKNKNINAQAIITHKAKQMKLVINNYVDGQVEALDNLFKE